MNIVGMLSRQLSPQRAVSLFQDQEERFQRVTQKLNRKISLADIVRTGVDVVLTELEKSTEGDSTNAKG